MATTVAPKPARSRIADTKLIEELGALRKERKELLRTLQAVEKGDFTARAAALYPSPVVDSLNNVIAMNQRVAKEFERVGRVVGKEASCSSVLRSRPRKAHGVRPSPPSTRSSATSCSPRSKSPA